MVATSQARRATYLMPSRKRKSVGVVVNYIPDAIQKKKVCWGGGKLEADADNQCSFCKSGLHKQVQFSLKTGKKHSTISDIMQPSTTSMGALQLQK